MAVELSLEHVLLPEVRLPLPENNQASIDHRTRDKNVCGDFPPADCGSVRRARLNAEAGIMSTANTVGLILSVLIALLLGAALMFPERF